MHLHLKTAVLKCGGLGECFLNKINVFHGCIVSDQGGRNGGKSRGQQPVTQHGSEAER